MSKPVTVHESLWNEFTQEIELPFEDANSASSFEVFLRTARVFDDVDSWDVEPFEVKIGRAIRSLLPMDFTLVGCGFRSTEYGIIPDKTILNVVLKFNGSEDEYATQLFKYEFQKLGGVLKSKYAKPVFENLVRKMTTKIREDLKYVTATVAKQDSKAEQEKLKKMNIVVKIDSTTKPSDEPMKVEPVTTEEQPKKKSGWKGPETTRGNGRPKWAHLKEYFPNGQYSREVMQALKAKGLA